MRYLSESEAEEARKFIREAALEAEKSTCRKSKRGVVIVKEGRIIGRGYNKVTIEGLCDPCIRRDILDHSRVELCSAVHAEQVAILDALNEGNNLKGSRMYHIRVKNKEIKTSGEPSCTVCSRIVLESGIKEFVLMQQKGFALYDSKEFNELSFNYFLK